jgi:hypothetical protein
MANERAIPFPFSHAKLFSHQSLGKDPQADCRTKKSGCLAHYSWRMTMRQIFVKLAAVAFIGLSGLGATAATASADTLTFGIHSGVVDVQYRDNDRRGDERDWGRNRHNRPGWGHGERRGRCAPWLAQDKARAFGLRRAQVVDVSPRRVVVEGRRHGDYRTVVFANVRGCPIIGR